MGSIFRKLFRLVLFLSVCLNIASAQDVFQHQFPAGITKPLAGEAQNVGLFSNFTTENGLPLDGIHSAIMDKNGNLWFGTAGGASRFDGKYCVWNQ